MKGDKLVMLSVYSKTQMALAMRKNGNVQVSIPEVQLSQNISQKEGQ